MMDYRLLNNSEILALTRQGCTCSDWGQFWVKNSFDPSRFRNVHFSGTLRLGEFTGHTLRPGGFTLPCGLYDSRIHNCILEDNLYISNVQILANYHVHTNAVIENTISIVVDGESRFGNGVEIEPLNEAGGRTLKIFDRLSSQIAYLLVLYRHHPEFTQKLLQTIDAYASARASTMGLIGEYCTISDCRTLTNIQFGAWAKISGAIRLENGTIASCREDPSFIGDGVIAKDFIALSGSHIDDHSTLTKCFVGEGVRIDKQFTAENSAFFANSEAYQGEACSIFAGPYTVTHHKSTLLIAGLYSFFNAGSGTNHSNHMYKLGPVHQGILERGSKTGSSSYLLWPSHIGPFTVVIGKHYAKFDTSQLPFSYIFENNGHSVILPSRNLLTAGTLRDSQKWPARDRRKNPEPLDLIRFELLTPYTIGKMLKGIEILRSLRGEDSHQEEYVKFNGIEINRFRIEYSCHNYEMAIRIFIGKGVLSQIEQSDRFSSWSQLRNCFTPMPENGLCDWYDLAGLIAPAPVIQKLIASIETGTLDSVAGLLAELNRIHAEYENHQWSWLCSLIENRQGIPCTELSRMRLAHLVEEWRSSSIELNEMIVKDSLKEFDEDSHLGFGIDGGREENEKDFEAVRGKIDSHPVIAGLRRDCQAIDNRARQALQILESLPE